MTELHSQYKPNIDVDNKHVKKKIVSMTELQSQYKTNIDVDKNMCSANLYCCYSARKLHEIIL